MPSLQNGNVSNPILKYLIGLSDDSAVKLLAAVSLFYFILSRTLKANVFFKKVLSDCFS